MPLLPAVALWGGHAVQGGPEDPRAVRACYRKLLVRVCWPLLIVSTAVGSGRRSAAERRPRRRPAVAAQ